MPKTMTSTLFASQPWFRPIVPLSLCTWLSGPRRQRSGLRWPSRASRYVRELLHSTRTGSACLIAEMIRQARIQHIPEAVALVRLAIEEMQRQGIDQWDDVYPTETMLRNDIDRGEMYLLDEDGVAAGIVTLNNVQSPEYSEIQWEFSGRILVVHRLAVHPEFRRQKVASRLMAFAEQDFAYGEYDAIRLDAFQKNPAAVALYERRGYRNAGSVTFRKGRFSCFEKRIGGSEERRSKH